MRPDGGMCLRSFLALCFLGSTLSCDCKDTIDGVHDGDRMHITVAAPFTGALRPSSQPGSAPCGSDAVALPTGTDLTLKARLVEPSDGCPVRVAYTVESIDAASFTPGSYGRADVRTPSGCSGTAEIDLIPFA